MRSLPKRWISLPLKPLLNCLLRGMAKPAGVGCGSFYMYHVLTVNFSSMLYLWLQTIQS